MTVKLATQPLCRYCGKPIRKRTTIVYVVPKLNQYHRSGSMQRYVEGVANSLADCRRFTNQQITSISYSPLVDAYFEKTGERLVEKFYEWDGESYADPYFCSGSCAQAFGYLMAKGGHCTRTFNEAMRNSEGGR